ncbi:Exosome complex exonuclease RRP44 [Papilio xuthus]|uniref:Protein DIS3 homolog n=1 Tax=Papilio xuthus TaxID=66420 RepID=A0A194QHD2_PAPXU|nr:Exosome complex exonuclease RRP44 [Papilio xuthus]
MMWTTKTFLTKTKRGNILKVVREHYLRDDLLCGSSACNNCPHKDNDYVLEAKPQSICALFDYDHYLVLDTNVVLHQIDILEEEALKNVIILQTVLEEVKHQNTAIFQRLLEIIGNKKRRFYSFVNEHHKDTYVERNPGEKQNDRNDRAIRKAASWYASHLSINNLNGQFPQIVLLTDDENNRKIAQEEGIVCCSVKDYIENVNGYVGLIDKLSKNVIPESCSKDALYPAHLTPSQVHAGIRNGKLYQGTFYASRDNYLEGSAVISCFEKPILLQGHIGINRAVDGDIVAIEVLPKEEWRKPSDIVLEDKADDQGDLLEEESELLPTVKPKDKSDEEITPTGKVVGIIRRKWRQYCGILKPSKFAGATRHLFTPAERKIPHVRIETRQSDVLASQRILVALDSWPRNSRYPLGHFVRSLGPIGKYTFFKNKHTTAKKCPLYAENEVILLEHDIPHARFSESVLACLPPEDWTITEEEIKKREDLRSLCICSVDPPGCTDIDDALHARALPHRTETGLRTYEVGVHIADVTHFVRPNTALDKEAASRSTTVYLVDKRIDMVPDLLSSNLCSLRGGEERLAFSCVWQIDENANVLSTKFHKSVIKSRSAMTYEEAQLIIDDVSREDEIAQSLRTLNTLAKKMKQKRLDNGALLLASPEIRFQSRSAMTYEEAQLIIDDVSREDEIAQSLRTLNTLAKKMKQKRLDNGALLLASPEIRFQVDSETHDPVEVQAKKILDTNSMVEEFMLLANVSVAERLAREFPQCALLRRHPAPPPAHFETFLKAVKQQGFDLDVSTNKSLSKSLDLAVIPSRPFFNTLVRIMATRCMQQAVYFASGTRPHDEFYHYGLACPIYTHFTSPIRRYADVMVHRLLAASIGADVTHASLLDTRAADALCENLNYRHRQAQYAGRASVALNTHEHFHWMLNLMWSLQAHKEDSPFLCRICEANNNSRGELAPKGAALPAILFKNRVEIESAVVLAVKRNALQVLIPKYGLEGPLYLPSDKFMYNEEEHIQVCDKIVFKTFDELTVRLTLDSSNLQHRKLVFQLVKPCIPGFSYVPEDETGQMDVEIIDVDKREVKEPLKTPKKRKDSDVMKKKKKLKK